MDETLRCLRDGVVDGRSAPFVLVQDSLDVLGGPALAAKLFSSLCKALRDGRSKAQALTMVASDESSRAYIPELQAVLGTSLQQPCPDPSSPDALQHILGSMGDATPGSEGLQVSTPSEGTAHKKPHMAVVVDSLSTLMLHHPVYQVLEWVDDVLQHPRLACLIATVHTDLHESTTASSLERMASCTVRALPCHGLPHVFAQAQQPVLAVEVCLKQRTGRVKVLTEYYQQLPDGLLSEVKPLLEPEKPLPRPQAEVPPAQDTAAVELAKKMTGGMRMTLTEQEAAARQSVLLPWEQRQAGAESQDEFVTAKAKAGIASKAEPIQAAGPGASYGQIFYERDSETDPDSDEDPDDDLDI